MSPCFSVVQIPRLYNTRPVDTVLYCNRVEPELSDHPSFAEHASNVVFTLRSSIIIYTDA